ncbi:hypothetical protein [Mycobacterium sp.]|uniref:hypothetical protein n=1 Tax=Mycobacterium sp. TaxID=1785 RepID=UPI002C553197|nr:hypothetical protein [Mycobacterium sp.]HME47547.1 hypothetical protein [Mycobacterium sp.]
MNKEDRGWPAYLFGGRVRTSTAALILAFIVVWFVYETYQPPAKPPPAPATQVVPPGFVPDPNYTWVPRTSVRQWSTTTTEPTTTTETTSPTESTTPSSTTTGTPSPGAPTTTTTPLPGAPPTATTPVLPGPAPAPPPSR